MCANMKARDSGSHRVKTAPTDFLVNVRRAKEGPRGSLISDWHANCWQHPGGGSRRIAVNLKPALAKECVVF